MAAGLELVRFDAQNRVAGLHPAVGQIATALSPFSAAANIIARLGAYALEVRAFNLQHDVVTRMIHTRQAAIVGMFERDRERAGQVRVHADRMLDISDAMARTVADPRSTKAQRRVAQEIVGQTLNAVVRLHVENRLNLIALSDVLALGETEAKIAAWRRRQAR